MRDLLLAAIVAAGLITALRRPWIGVLLWCWLSLMNPHRYTYGFAYDAPFALLTALCTAAGMLFAHGQRESPFKGSPPVILGLLMVWITLSWLMGLDTAGDQEQWEKVMKIDVMVLVALCVLRTKQQIFALVWVCAASLALLGAKGGVFTILNAGNYRVWGPPGSFIFDNNQFALALVITIPLLRFLQMQLQSRWARHGMTLWMVLVAASAVGSYSRGALLSISAMAIMLWWRGRNRFTGGLAIAAVAVVLLAFMPDQWGDRMSTINTYDEDRSAMGRFAAWHVAWGIGKNYLFGVGFNAAQPFLFSLYAPDTDYGTPAAHSIYFQILGHHGFVGLVLYLALGFTTYRWAGKLRKEAAAIPEARWCVDLANMCQVSLLGFAVGGSFLSLAYFDLPYYSMVIVVLTRLWVRRKAWVTEPVYAPGWRTLPGLATAAANGSAPATSTATATATR